VTAAPGFCEGPERTYHPKRSLGRSGASGAVSEGVPLSPLHRR
jgi:hypothetical protein